MNVRNIVLLYLVVRLNVEGVRTYERPEGYEHRDGTDDFESFASIVPEDALRENFGKAGCDLLKIDASNLSIKEFRRRFGESSGFSGGVVFTNAVDADALSSGFSINAILSDFGRLQVHVRHSEILADHDGTAKKSLSFETYAEQLNNKTSTDVIFEHNHDPGESQAFKALARALDGRTVVPSFLAERNAMRIFSFGGAGMSVGLHNHEANFFVHAHGSKAWFVAPPGPRPPVRHACLYRPERLPSGMRSCVVDEGEILFLSAGWWHATCNLDRWTAGYGAEARVPWEGRDDARLYDAIRFGSLEALRNAKAPWSAWTSERVCRPKSRPDAILVAIQDLDSRVATTSLPFLKERGCFEESSLVQRRGPPLLCAAVYRLAVAVRHGAYPEFSALRFLIRNVPHDAASSVGSCTRMLESIDNGSLMSESTQEGLRDAICAEHTTDVLDWICDASEEDATSRPVAFLADVCARGCGASAANPEL